MHSFLFIVKIQANGKRKIKVQNVTNFVSATNRKFSSFSFLILFFFHFHFYFIFLIVMSDTGDNQSNFEKVCTVLTDYGVTFTKYISKKTGLKVALADIEGSLFVSVYFFCLLFYFYNNRLSLQID